MLKIFLLILISASIYSETIFLASFNTLHLGWKGKDYSKTAKVLYQFDIIGLQEVMNEEGLLKLQKELEFLTKERWDYLISEENIGKGKYKEYYAYIWKRKKVRLIKSLGFYKENEENEFSREPYGATFKSKNFDFTFVISHFIYGEKKKDRRDEAIQLDEVYDYFQNINEKEEDVIIGGDFNLKVDDGSFDQLLKHKDEIYFVADTKYKTTIGNKGLSSSYDNLFFSKRYTKEFTGKYGIHDFTKNNYSLIRKTVSDHLPVFMELRIDLEDDD